MRIDSTLMFFLGASAHRGDSASCFWGSSSKTCPGVIKCAPETIGLSAQLRRGTALASRITPWQSAKKWISTSPELLRHTDVKNIPMISIQSHIRRGKVCWMLRTALHARTEEKTEALLPNSPNIPHHEVVQYSS